MLKNMLKKANPPLPAEIKEKRGFYKLSRDKSSFLDKKRKSSRKRDYSRGEDSYANRSQKSNSQQKKYKSIEKSRAGQALDRIKKKKQYELMKSYSINSAKSGSIEPIKRGKERRKKNSVLHSKNEYGSISNKFKGSSNYISRSFLRSGSDNKSMLKISEKIRSFRAQYKQ